MSEREIKRLVLEVLQNVLKDSTNIADARLTVEKELKHLDWLDDNDREMEDRYP